MSRWLRKSLRVILHPDKLLLGSSPWPGNRPPVAMETLAVARSGDGPVWRHALTRLDEHLASSGFCGPMNIALSHHFVRFADLPWQSRILSRPLRAIQADHRFKQLFGAAHSGWRATVSDSAHGEAALAAAVENELIAAIEKIASKYAVEIRSIEPWGVATINTFRPQLLGGRNAALVLAETQKQVVLFFVGTVLAGVATRKGSDASHTHLVSTVRQEAAAIGLSDCLENIFVARHGEAFPALPIPLGTPNLHATKPVSEQEVQTTA